MAAQALDNAKASAEDVDAALRAAHEAPGVVPPGAAAAVEMQPEAGSRSAQGLARSAWRATAPTGSVDIRPRDLPA